MRFLRWMKWGVYSASIIAAFLAFQHTNRMVRELKSGSAPSAPGLDDLAALDKLLKARQELNPEQPAPAPLPKIHLPPKLTDTNSASHKVRVSQSNHSKTAAQPGGAVLVDASGHRYEIQGPPPAKVENVEAELARLSRVDAFAFPINDDDLPARKRRAYLLLGTTLLAAICLVLAARRLT